MNCTIIADAPYCPDTCVAGYGYWIASDRGKLGGGGVMTSRDIKSSIVAELMACANSLHVAIMRELVCEWDKVLLQTDCTAAIAAIEGVRLFEHLDKQERSVVRYVHDLMTQKHISIEMRHVKGHTNRRDPRHRANHMCDLRAKEQMRALRDSIYERYNQQKELFNERNQLA